MTKAKLLAKLREPKVQQRTYTTFFLFLIFLLSLIVIILKSLSVIRFSEAPLLYTYSIVFAAFQLARIGSSILYRSVAHENLEAESNFAHYEPSVTFVIPCKNEEKVIYENIAHCYDVEYPSEEIEVIVVNDGSTDGTLKEIRRAANDFPGLRIIDWGEVNRGKRHAMAAAVRQAKGEIVIQLDSDSYIKKSDFRKLLSPFKDDRIGAVCAHADPTNKDQNLLTKAQAAYYFMAFRILKAAESTFNLVLCCSGCCSAYRKSTIMPLIDEFENEKFLGVNINFGDDRSLTNLILKHGKTTVYTNNVQAYTIVPETLRQLLKQQVRWKKSWFINTSRASKYIWKLDWFLAIIYFYPLALVTLVTPFMAIYGLIILPLTHHVVPYYFILGSVVMTMLFALITRLMSKDNVYWKYLGVWALLNTFMLTFILPYSLLTIRNGKWGTR